ncbi:MAG: YdcF family protein [Fimbriimonadaceae bacterium]|nr:YdcF family protein [Fimbriimonadaceae bacterium]
MARKERASTKASKRRRILRWLAGVSFVALAGLITVNQVVLSSTAGRIYTSTDLVPSRPVALVLGTSPTVAGRKNLFFERRMDAAAKLYRSGKVKAILVSGDNGSVYYDEPGAMQKALVQRGVPTSAITQDHAGFRTLDSVLRAKRVFGVKAVTLVTDDFHLPRALFIARHEGLDAVGFQTKPLPPSVSPKTYVREVGSRALMFVDLYVLKREPKFGGPPIAIRY